MKFSVLLPVSLAIAFALPVLVLAAPRFDFPPMGKYQVLRGDFHMHTINSDGRATTHERIEESKRLGYDVVAITDHGNMKSWRIEKSVAEQLGLIVIRGHESGMKGKEHYVVLSVDDPYAAVDGHKWADQPGQETAFYQDQMKYVSDHGGLIIWAHPHVGLRECTIWGAENGFIQGLELKNEVVGTGWNTANSHGTHWYPFALEWAMKYDLAVFANSDVHSTRDENSPVTLLLVIERTAKGTMDAIRARRTIAWFNGMLWGRQELLSQLIGAMVTAKRSDAKTTLSNTSPVALKGSIADTSFELPAYGSVDLPAASGAVTVKWTNVWYGLSDNLEMTYGD